MINDWHIQSRSHTCQQCGKPFHEGGAFHTILLDDRKSFLRLDLCGECGVKRLSEARDNRGFISHWQGLYEAPPPPEPEAIQKDTAEGLLRKLTDLNDPRYLAASYILAVMLERKRLLRVKEQVRHEGRRTFIYEHPKTGDVFTIPDPDLQLDQLEEVQRLVGDLLGHGLNGPAAESSTSTDAQTPVSEPSSSTSADASETEPVTEREESDAVESASVAAELPG